jgi:ribonuclease D
VTDETTVIPLLEPRDGIPPVIEGPADLARVVRAFAEGTGPVAVDAERASGYRYSGRAYLVQLRRTGAGSALIDPTYCPDLSELDAALADAEIVLHAASQDLPCLAELNFHPRELFDTELAGRLLGYERVGLGLMVENVLGLKLEKGHSAADWSTRPLPEDWLRYAALDVEVLIELRDILHQELKDSGKLAWAQEEFAAVLAHKTPGPRTDPWRRTSGIHKVRSLRGLAVVRELWTLRDEFARESDVAPGRVLPDSAIVAAAEIDPKDERTLLTLPGFGGRSVRRLARNWLDALDTARGLPDDALPTNPPIDGPPPPHRWAERDPVAAGRLSRSREVVTTTAAAHKLPPENLIAPDSIRRLAWTPPEDVTPETISSTLRGYGARAWQVGLIATDLAAALADPDPKPTPEADYPCSGYSPRSWRRWLEDHSRLWRMPSSTV